MATSEFATGTLRDRDGNDRTRQTARADHADETRPADAGPVSPEQEAGSEEIGQARLRRHVPESAQTMPMSRAERRGADTTRVETDLDTDPGLRERRSL